MADLVFAYPGDLETPTGGYGYDRRIIAGLRSCGHNVQLLALGDGFPFPSADILRSAEKLLSDLPRGQVVVIDGLAFGVMEKVAKNLADHLKLIALVHHPLCRENGLTAEVAERLEVSERKALRHVRHVIVTSPATATQVEELFSVALERISVIVPGTDLPDLPDLIEETSGQKVRLLSVGTLVPRKGHDLLFKALANLKHLEWHLDIVGGSDADPACADRLVELLEELQLTQRVTFHGAVKPDQLPEFYKNADVFVLASRYEGFGMAFTEALAFGLPVIGSGAGAVRQTLPEKGAIYCGVEDVSALKDALECLVSDPARRKRMGESARASAESLPSWADAVRGFEVVLEKQSA